MIALKSFIPFLLVVLSFSSVVKAQSSESIIAKCLMVNSVSEQELVDHASTATLAEIEAMMASLSPSQQSLLQGDSAMARRMAVVLSSVLMNSTEQEQAGLEAVNVATWVVTHGDSASVHPVMLVAADRLRDQPEWTPVVQIALSRQDIYVVANTLLDLAAAGTAHIVITDQWLSSFADTASGSHVQAWQSHGAVAAIPELALLDDGAWDSTQTNIATIAIQACKMALAVQSDSLGVYLQQISQDTLPRRVQFMEGLAHCVSSEYWISNVATDTSVWDTQARSSITQIYAMSDVAPQLGQVSAAAIVHALCMYTTGPSELSRAIFDGIQANPAVDPQLLAALGSNQPC